MVLSGGLKWDRLCQVSAALGAVAGGALTIPLSTVTRESPFLWGIPWRSWILDIFLMPLFPAVVAFLSCFCVHNGARGWPFPRSGAALAAYFGWTPAVLGYGALQYLPRYSDLAFVTLQFAWAFAGSFFLTFVVVGAEHRRVRHEADLSPGPRRLRLRDVIVYEAIAIAFGTVAIPQAITQSGRAGPFVMLFLLIPLFLFAIGSLRLGWATVSGDRNRKHRDLLTTAFLHAPSLVLILWWSFYVFIFFVLPGRYTWKDPYYQTVVTDPTLALTPFLGFGLAATFGYLVWSQLRQGVDPMACRVVWKLVLLYTVLAVYVIIVFAR